MPINISTWDSFDQSGPLATFLHEVIPRRGWKKNTRPKRGEERFLSAVQRKLQLLANAMVRVVAPRAPLTIDELLSIHPQLNLLEWLADRGNPQLQVQTAGSAELASRGYKAEFISECLQMAPAKAHWLQLATLQYGHNAMYDVEYEIREGKLSDGREFCALAREMFGNPFIYWDYQLRTTKSIASTAYPLALEMYRNRDFTLMPQLGKLLREAGCKDDRILAHCDSTETHYKGCWVVDLVLGVYSGPNEPAGPPANKRRK